MTNLVRICIILVVGWVALVYGRSGLWLGSVASIVFGILWIVGNELRRDDSAVAGLTVFTVLAVIGLFLELPALAMLIATTGSLVAWNLQLFESRLVRSGRINDRTTVVRIYLERLAIIAALSLVLGGIGLGVELQFNLVAAVGLGGLAVLLLARILRQN
jgi:hypothetical protein